jgi:IS30 family transposase
MGSSYGQLSYEERCEIAELHRAGRSIRQIAAALDRQPSTVSRELKRNTGSGAKAGPYRPAYAEKQAAARRWSGARLERNAELRKKVLGLLDQGWSPEQVVGRLKREAGRTVIGCETIYRFIYAQLRRTNDGRWRLYLPQAKCRRGRRRKKSSGSALSIKERRPIAQRPPEASDRVQPGHWEADFMLFARYGQQILLLHERTSRFTALVRTSTRKAKSTAKAISRLLAALPEPMKRSLTFDNGTEFAQHYTLSLPTFFCDTRAPWQKGGVENAVGRFRRFLPRRTNLDQLKASDIRRIAQAYNHTPRKSLDFRTPAEVFSQVLHFERESTSPLSRG